MQRPHQDAPPAQQDAPPAPRPPTFSTATARGRGRTTVVAAPAARGARPAGRRVLLVGHLVVAVSLIGGALVLVGLGVAGLRGADPRMVYPAAHLVDAWVVAPLVGLALATGVLQALLTPWGLTTYWWVTIKLAITAAAGAVVVFVLEPRLAAASEAAMAGHPFERAAFLPLVVAPSVAVALLVVNVALGVYKPTWRLPSRTTGERS